MPNGKVEPLTLRLDTQMRADFLKRDFHLPGQRNHCRILRAPDRAECTAEREFRICPGDPAPGPSEWAPAASRCDTRRRSQKSALSDADPDQWPPGVGSGGASRKPTNLS